MGLLGFFYSKFGVDVLTAFGVVVGINGGG